VTENSGNNNLFYQQLRARAERQLTNAGRIKGPALVPMADGLIHELHVHQIELEMQNEELRRAQVALETSRAHYLELYDFAPVGYLTLTDEGMVTEMNLTAAKLLGGERNNLIRRRFAQFVADGDKDRWYQLLLLARHQGRKQSAELAIRREDGTGLFVRFDCECKEADDARSLLRIALTDITDYQRAKELEAQRTEMEREFRLHVATQTAAAIAHELNQPLTAIAYYAYVAQELLQSGNMDPQKLSGVLGKCGQQAQRAGDVIRQLMEILQKGEVASEPVDINASANYALAFVKAQGDWDAFSIVLELDEGLPPVTANQLQIQKVLANLVQNGLESMRKSGIKTGAMTITACRSADNPAMALVTVRDCGKGVADAACLKTLFQPIGTTNAKGFGLSLAVSQALIESHGGKMWAEQNVGPGLSVRFTLPFVA
jgi:PAS domain S-box-containing protein